MKNDYSLDRGLPASPEAERSILGAILLDNAVQDETRTSLKAEHFFLDAHRRIYQRIYDLADTHRPIDIVTLTEELMQHKELEAVGGAGYLASLTDGVPRRSSLSHYISIVIEKARARWLIHAANGIVGTLLEYGSSVDDALADFRASVESIGISEEGYHELAEFENEVFKGIDHLRTAKNELPGWTYGIAGIDRVTGGMYPGEVTIVAARTGVGKSSFALGTTIANSQHGTGVHYRSDEMRGQSIFGRTLSAISGVNGFKIRNPKSLSDDEYDWITQAGIESRALPIGIDDKPKLHVDQVLARAAQNIRRRNKQVFIFDFVQRMTSTGKDMREKVGYSIRSIADFSRFYGVHSIVVSQISRLDKRSDGVPTMEDLKESGELEENADCVILLWRSGSSDASKVDPDLAIIAKQRNGAADLKVDLEFNKNRLLYEDFRKEVKTAGLY